MNKAIVPIALIGLAVVGGAAFVGRDNLFSHFAPSALSGEHINWSIGYSNELKQRLGAEARHSIDGGGFVNLIATCVSENDFSSITLGFNYFTEDDKGDGAASSYDNEGGGVVAVPYSIDDGEIKQSSRATRYKNAAEVMFGYISPKAKMNAGDMIAASMATMSGGTQELRPFLHAREVKFQLPLAGGSHEIVSIYPQDASFRDFVRQCNIDPQKLDAEARAHVSG